MGREQYRTPDEDVAAEFERVSHLFRLALGKPSERLLFDSLMAEASEKGLNWVQGLEYVLERRRIEDACDFGASSFRRAAGKVRMAAEAGDLRQAG